MKQLTVLTENRPGILAELASLLGTHGVNMESISAETFPDGAIIRFITKDAKTARHALEKNNYRVVESEVLVLGVMDRPGELGKMAKKLADKNINIENIYLLTRKDNKAILALKVNNQTLAEQEFKDYLVKV